MTGRPMCLACSLSRVVRPVGTGRDRSARAVFCPFYDRWSTFLLHIELRSWALGEGFLWSEATIVGESFEAHFQPMQGIFLVL